jgi:hypothetical protein
MLQPQGVQGEEGSVAKWNRQQPTEMEQAMAGTRARTMAVLVAVAVLAVAALGGAAPASVGAPGPEATGADGHEHHAHHLVIDHEEWMQDCLELVPESVSISGVTDDGQRVLLTTLVLLDFEEGVDIARLEREGRQEEADAAFAALVEKVEALLEPGDVSYDELDIDLAYEFELLDPLDGDGEPIERDYRSAALLQQAKDAVGGVRPMGIDLVYLLTDQSITDAAGRADCIGGIRFDEHAFAVGEAFEPLTFLGTTFYSHATAKIFVHEIGHLLGAHHHYANCAEGVPAINVEDRDPAPCTVMFNFLDFLTLRFSTLSGAVVRGHAVDYADSRGF